MLVGSLLTVTPVQVAKTAGLYGAVGLCHWWARRPHPHLDRSGCGVCPWLAVRWWDFLFYASFGVVVTSSVRIAGVLLVFAYLIVPGLGRHGLGRSGGRGCCLAGAWPMRELGRDRHLGHFG